MSEHDKLVITYEAILNWQTSFIHEVACDAIDRILPKYEYGNGRIYCHDSKGKFIQLAVYEGVRVVGHYIWRDWDDEKENGWVLRMIDLRDPACQEEIKALVDKLGRK